jgi:glycogen debranching enzyme
VGADQERLSARVGALDATAQVSAAEAVLERNRAAGWTRPGPHLYPHQWSWDAAFIAIGLRHRQPERARDELRSLFRGQWRNGLLPHIVFGDGEPGSPYFPGPDVWRTDRSPDAPREPRTSGIVQPPLHATAAWLVHERAPDPGFLRDLYPLLCAWHDYLYRERDPGGDGLVAIRHPWESGQDDSPAWDAARAALPQPARPVPRARRSDLAVVSDAERPTLADYGDYLALVELFREHDYEEAALRSASPFLVADPLFNALLARAGHDLGQIAAAIGADPGPHRDAASRTAAAVETRLWDDDRGLYQALDLRAKRRSPVPVAAGFIPLFAQIPSPDRADRLVATLTGPGFWPGAREGHPIPTVGRRDPAFEPRRYWRGPAWVNVDWLVARGLRRYGRDELAGRLEAAVMELVAGAGFHEYFDPDTGAGYGTDEFSWTAALTLDLLLSGAPPGS